MSDENSIKWRLPDEFHRRERLEERLLLDFCEDRSRKTMELGVKYALEQISKLRICFLKKTMITHQT